MYSVAAHQSYDRSERRPHPRAQPAAQQPQLNQVGDAQGHGNAETSAKHKRRSKHRLSITARLFNYIKQQFQKEEEEEFEDFQIFVARHRPEELAKLARTTKFTRKEIQVIYRGFKQECPTGTVDEDSFKKIFSAFFPQGDARQYAHYVFNTINKENVTGKISFEDFLGILSKVSRGSIQEKLQWIFGLYDLNGDGNITKGEMLDVVTSIYEMLGRSTNPAVGEHTAKEHVEKIFGQIDTNKDGVVTIDELVEWCSRDEQILQSLDTLDTVL